MERVFTEQCVVHPADRSNYLHLHPELQFPVGGFHCQHHQPVRGEPSHCLWYCRMYRIDRYRLVRRTCGRTDRMYHGIPDAVRDLCHQDVPEPSGTSDPSGDPDRTVGRRYRGMGQRFLRSEIPVASLHRNAGYPVDRIRPTVNVHHDQRQ